MKWNAPLLGGGAADRNARSGSGSAAAPAEEEDLEADAQADKVYRPLLFQSKGYASSELFRDTYEMRARMRENQQRVLHSGQDDQPERSSDARIQAHIRLETLSSRAATTVLGITYLVFVFAFVLPYILDQGYLKTVVQLPGDVCTVPVEHHVPCTYVDPKKNVAQWYAYIHNVSWLAGSIELNLDIHDIFNTSLVGEQLTTSTQLDESPYWSRLSTQLYGGSNDFDTMNEGFALKFDAYLYGVNEDTVPATRDRISTEVSQSVWVDCPTREVCDTVKLMDVSQDFDGLGGGGYGIYLVIVVFKGAYPNTFGKHVDYEFAYTKPVVRVSELIIRWLFLLGTIFSMPCWLIAVLNYHGSWSNALPVQRWVMALGIVLILWQNPVYAAAEWWRTVSLRTRFVSAMCESIAEAFFYVFWLNLVDQHGQRRLYSKLAFGVALLAVDTGMAVIRMPKLFFSGDLIMPKKDEIYVILGFVRIAMLLGWLVWIARISWRTGHHLRQLPYMNTRFQQLSFRFLFLETSFILISVLGLSGMQVFHLMQTWYRLGYNAFLHSAVQTFASEHSGHSSLGKFIFLSVYVYLVMFVHLPPSTGETTGLLGTTAFHVEEKPRIDKYGFLTPDSHLFCVETATWLLEIAWQAYFDPPGRPSPSGYGELNLEPYNFELVTHLRSSLTDTHVLVALHHDQKRLVVAFRGTTSKQNWKSNLLFHQEVLWIKSRGLTRERTCMESLKDFAAKIPLLNMALPRVHSGFWNAYASTRAELKEVIRLILDENPGVSVYITGHSMGGALAVLAAYDLAVNFNMKVNMYNFGGPRVGNPSFSRYYDKCVPTSYRVVMDGDIVPGVPGFWGLYQHVGTEVSIDLEGNLIVDPSFVEHHLHVSSKRKVATHPSSVYRASIAKCLDNLSTN